MSGQDDSALPAMQRAARQLPPGWEIGALIPGTLTREVLHPDWRGTPVTLHISDDHPMRLTWTCGAVSVREFGDFARTSLSDYPELMRLIRPAPPPEDVVEQLLMAEKQRAAAALPAMDAECVGQAVGVVIDAEAGEVCEVKGRALATDDVALIKFAVNNLAAMLDALAAERQRADEAEAGLCRELIAERDALRAELRLTVDAEVGRAGLPGWRYAGTRLWTRWLGPRDESEEETFPLLRAEHDLSGRWAWEVLGPEYVNMARGVSDGALAAMRACEQAVGSVVLAAVRTSGKEGG